MKTDTRITKCPICGHKVRSDMHSRIGERATPDGPVEYWACFSGSEIFSIKLYDEPDEEDGYSWDEPA